MTNSVEFDEALINESQLVSNFGVYFDKGSICLLMVRLTKFADIALTSRDSRKEFQDLVPKYTFIPFRLRKYNHIVLKFQVQWIQQRAQNLIITSDDRIEVDERINEVVDGYQKYDVQKRIVNDQVTYMLIVRRLVLTDAGNYTCKIVVTGATQHPSKVGQMIVLSEYLA